MQAITEGRELADDIAGKVTKKKISTGDAEVLLVFAEKENLGKLAGIKFFTAPNPQADAEDLRAMRKHFHHIPVGYVVCVLDRKKRSFMAHARPLLLQDPALRLLEKMVEEIAELKDWRLS